MKKLILALAVAFTTIFAVQAAKPVKIIFDTDMAGGFSPFFLKEGYGLKLSFPDESQKLSLPGFFPHLPASVEDLL